MVVLSPILATIDIIVSGRLIGPVERVRQPSR
jgi:hypothetical protein